MFGRKATTQRRDGGARRAAPVPQDDERRSSPCGNRPAAVARKSVEQLLLERGQITESHLDQARTLAAKTPARASPSSCCR
jgi:hypothetical protein